MRFQHQDFASTWSALRLDVALATGNLLVALVANVAGKQARVPLDWHWVMIQLVAFDFEVYRRTARSLDLNLRVLAGACS